MNKSGNEFDRFVRAVHLRWVAWRVIERAGVATLWACALALPMIVVLWFRGERALPVAILSLSVGALFGAIWGAFRRPTVLETAIEADRQFELHDLLGTAVTLGRAAHTDNATRATIIASADAHCRRLAPSRMVLNRLGARAWAGIGLANALVITLSLMTTAPTATIAQVEDQPALARQRDSHSRPHASPTARQASQPSAAHRTAQPLATDSGRDGEPDGRRADGSPSNPRARPDVATPADGAGSAAQTDRTTSRRQPALATGRETTDGTTAAAGAGTAAVPDGDGTDRAAGGLTGPARSSAPPWRAATWDADRARALRDVERGAVPDRYRDLIRAYFDHAPKPD